MSQQTHGLQRLGLGQTAIAENRTLFMIFGISLVILGFVAISFPFLTTIAAKTFLGWLFLIGGVFQALHAVSTKSWGQFLLNLAVAASYLVIGGWLAFFPLAGIIALTLLLAAMFVAQGILEFCMALRMRPQPGWAVVLISGIVAIVVGVMIFAKLPSSAVWAVGLLVGIKMIMSGWAYFFLAFAARNKA